MTFIKDVIFFSRFLITPFFHLVIKCLYLTPRRLLLTNPPSLPLFDDVLYECCHYRKNGGTVRDSGPSFLLNPKCLPGETWKWAICTTYVVQPKTAATSSLHGPKQFAILDHLLHVERIRDKWLNILFNTVWPDCFWTIAYIPKQGYENSIQWYHNTELWRIPYMYVF